MLNIEVIKRLIKENKYNSYLSDNLSKGINVTVILAWSGAGISYHNGMIINDYLKIEEKYTDYHATHKIFAISYFDSRKLKFDTLFYFEKVISFKELDNFKLRNLTIKLI